MTFHYGMSNCYIYIHSNRQKMATTKLHNWLTFNQDGNLRGFSSGFRKVEAKKLIFRDIEDGNVVVQVDSLLKVPQKFIEGYYHKTSKNNDLQEFLTL